MDMVDVTVRRCYPVLLAAIAFAISGCATPVGLGRQTDRQFQENELDLSRPDLDPDMTPGIQSRGFHDILRRQLAFSYGLVDPFIEGPSGEVCASPTALTTIELAQWTPASCGPVD